MLRGLQVDCAHVNNVASMQQVVKDALSGPIVSRIRGDGDIERVVAREQVSTDILNK